MSHTRLSCQPVVALVALLLGALVLPVTPVSAQASGSGAAPPPARQAPRGIRIMSLTSPAFESGALIPDRHAQTGRDVSPPLAWSGAPDSTRSYVLLVHDANAAIGDGTDDTLHWLVWNIPGRATGLAEGMPGGAQLADGTRQISVSGPYYRGPAAPAAGEPHHYVFELYAIDTILAVAPAALPPMLTREAVMRAMAGHVRGKAVLVGRYRRPAPSS